MLLQKLATLAGRAPFPPTIGLELRPDRFSLIYLDSTLDNPPLILKHYHHSLPPSHPDAAASALRDTWQRLALPDKRVILSVPYPIARFTLGQDGPVNTTPASLLAKLFPETDVASLVFASTQPTTPPGHMPQTLLGAITISDLDAVLAILDHAGLKPAQVHIDVLALLTAYSHMAVWTTTPPLIRTLVHIGDDGYFWHALSSTHGLPNKTGHARDSEALAETLLAQVPDLLFLAGPSNATHSLMSHLQIRLPATRFCTNPFTSYRLANDQDRRTLTAQAPELAVALGLALGARP